MISQPTEWLILQQRMDWAARALDENRPDIGFACLFEGLQRCVRLCEMGLTWAPHLRDRYSSFLGAYTEEVIARFRERWRQRLTG